MNIASICTRHIVSIERSASLQEAARLMREHHVGAVVVTVETAQGHHVAGVVTDRDLAVEVLARGVDAAQVEVGRLLQAEPVSIAESAELMEAIQAMQAAGVRRLLVRGADGHLAGVVSFDDLIEACAAPLLGLAGVVRKGLEREAAQRAPLPAPPGRAIRMPAMGTAGWSEPIAGRP